MSSQGAELVNKKTLCKHYSSYYNITLLAPAHLLMRSSPPSPPAWLEKYWVRGESLYPGNYTSNMSPHYQTVNRSIMK